MWWAFSFYNAIAGEIYKPSIALLVDVHEQPTLAHLVWPTQRIQSIGFHLSHCIHYKYLTAGKALKRTKERDETFVLNAHVVGGIQLSIPGSAVYTFNSKWWWLRNSSYKYITITIILKHSLSGSTSTGHSIVNLHLHSISCFENSEWGHPPNKFVAVMICWIVTPQPGDTAPEVTGRCLL